MAAILKVWSRLRSGRIKKQGSNRKNNIFELIKKYYNVIYNNNYNSYQLIQTLYYFK
jgi:hypothetical protein